MDGTEDVLTALKVELSGAVGYVKARDLAEYADLTARQVAVRLHDIGDDESLPVSVEKWSRTGGCITYRVEIADNAELSAAMVV